LTILKTPLGKPASCSVSTTTCVLQGAHLAGFDDGSAARCQRCRKLVADKARIAVPRRNQASHAHWRENHARDPDLFLELEGLQRLDGLRDCIGRASLHPASKERWRTVLVHDRFHQFILARGNGLMHTPQRRQTFLARGA